MTLTLTQPTRDELASVRLAIALALSTAKHDPRATRSVPHLIAYRDALDTLLSATAPATRSHTGQPL